MITTARRKVERDLANLLKAIAFWDIHIENYRIGMAENHSFNVVVGFQQIDTGKKGYVTKRQLHQFLSSGQVNCSHKENDQIVSQCFKGEEITFEDFRNFILPKTNELLRKHHYENKENIANLVMLQFNRESLLRFFERILTSIRELSQLRSQLNQECQYDIHEIWKIVSVKCPSPNGNLQEQALKEFVEANGGHFNNQEFKALLRYLLCEQEQDYITQTQFNQLIEPPLVVVSNQFNDEIQDRVKLKYQQLGLQYPAYRSNTQILGQEGGVYNFRKVFDPVREGRPQFQFDPQYMDQLKDYKNKYLAPSRNYELQYRNPPLKIKNHDYFFQDFYLNLHEQDQEELYFNRFGKRYVYK